MSNDAEDRKWQELQEYLRTLQAMSPLEVLETLTFDFRSNLTTIKGFTKLSLNSDDNHEYIEDIMSAVQNMVDQLEVVHHYIEEIKSGDNSG